MTISYYVFMSEAVNLKKYLELGKRPPSVSSHFKKYVIWNKENIVKIWNGTAKKVRYIKGTLFEKYAESRFILQRQIGESVGTWAKGTQFRKVRYFKGP